MADRAHTMASTLSEATDTKVLRWIWGTGITNEHISGDKRKNENVFRNLTELQLKICCDVVLENVQVCRGSPWKSRPSQQVLWKMAVKRTLKKGGLIKGLYKGNSFTWNSLLPKGRQNQAAGIYLQQKQLTLSQWKWTTYKVKPSIILFFILSAPIVYSWLPSCSPIPHSPPPKQSLPFT